jgi:hypothetical protein
MPGRQKRATSLFLQASFHFASPPQGDLIFRVKLGPGTRQPDLENLLALGMKNYGAHRLRSRRQESLKISCGDALRRGTPICVVLDNNVNFSGIGFGLIVPSIPWDGRGVGGSQLPAGFRRGERDRWGAEACALVALVQRDFQAEDTFGDYLRADLAEQSPYPLDRYEVSLEIARFNDGERDEAFVGYLRALFADRPPDLIVTMVSPQRASFSATDEICFRRRPSFLPLLTPGR